MSLDAFVAQLPIQRRLLRDFVEHAAAGLPAGTRLLDAGAGDSPYAELFSHVTYTATDWDKSVHGATSADVIAPLDSLPLEDASFDAVLCTEVLEHVARPEAVLSELHRVLVPGGALWLTVPFVGPLHEQPYDFYRYTEFALEELLSAAGFVDIELKRLGGYFTALGALVHGFGAATGVRGSGDYARRGLAAVARGVGRRLPALDRMDRAGVLPLGYGVRARRASTSRE